MAFIEVNGFPVVEGIIQVPRIGVWAADLVIDTDIPLSGDVTITLNDGELTYVGTAYPGRSGVFVGTDHTRVVGGKGGLNNLANPKFYQQVPMSLILNDLLSTAGETLSSVSDQSVLQTRFPFWTTMQQPISGSVFSLILSSGASWRILVDGTLWVGQETWPDSKVDYTLLTFDPREAKVTMGAQAPILLPGQNLPDFGHVEYVETTIKTDSIRQVAWLA